jgi:protein-tyrosine kinase
MNKVEKALKSKIEKPLKSKIEKALKSKIEKPLKSKIEEPPESKIEKPLKSKVEKALNKAREERRRQPGTGSDSPEDWEPLRGTALIPEPRGELVRLEDISRMKQNDLPNLEAEDLARHGIIHAGLADDPAVQAFRDLRTKIILQGQGENGVILVSAMNKGSGSSFVARNLAAAFAFDAGNTALLVDCNLRNPSLHRLLEDPSTPGLTDYLENPDIDLSTIIQPVGISRFRVITAGKRHEIPAEYFSSSKMRRLIELVRRRYQERFIILDGPSMSDIADIRVLSELCDYVLLVGRYGHVTGGQVEKCVKEIGGKKLLGIVFNDEPSVPRINWRELWLRHWSVFPQIDWRELWLRHWSAWRS